jgi:hypothetical protein
LKSEPETLTGRGQPRRSIDQTNYIGHNYVSRGDSRETSQI